MSKTIGKFLLFIVILNKKKLNEKLLKSFKTQALKIYDKKVENEE
jgi:hypothetical protein